MVKYEMFELATAMYIAQEWDGRLGRWQELPLKD